MYAGITERHALNTTQTQSTVMGSELHGLNFLQLYGFGNHYIRQRAPVPVKGRGMSANVNCLFGTRMHAKPCLQFQPVCGLWGGGKRIGGTGVFTVDFSRERAIIILTSIFSL